MILSSISGIVVQVAAGSEKHARTLGQGLVRLAFAVDAAYRSAGRDLDLTAQQAQLLCAVGLATGEDGRPVAANRPTAIGGLAAALQCDQSNASRLVDRAARRGLLVRRRGGGGDGRVTLVELTDEGRRCLGRFIANLQEKAIDPYFAGWAPERQAGALATLNELADTLEGCADAR
jgi:DNA-binding MarR family transcriptional regulator